MDQVQAIVEVRNTFAQAFNEALKTYGPAVSVAAVATFAAGVVHQAEHMMTGSEARWIALGRWTDNFHAHLDYLNTQCDAQPKMPLPPLNGFEGQA
jgi:hypothetical protein